MRESLLYTPYIDSALEAQQKRTVDTWLWRGLTSLTWTASSSLPPSTYSGSRNNCRSGLLRAAMTSFALLFLHQKHIYYY
jgi:hypothetical protein